MIWMKSVNENDEIDMRQSHTTTRVLERMNNVPNLRPNSTMI